MIQAAKADIIYSFHKSNISLQKYEVDLFISCLSRLSGIAGILTGFSLSSFVRKPSISGGAPLDICLLVSSSISSGCFLLCLVICLCLTLWGPGLALHGSGGVADVFRSVQLMERGLDFSFIVFCTGLVAHVLVCIFQILSTVKMIPFGFFATVTILFVASRIWSVGEDIIKELVPRNVTSAILKGDPAPINRNNIYPKFYKLNQPEYNLLSQPQAYPGSLILKAWGTESDSTSSGDDENDDTTRKSYGRMQSGYLPRCAALLPQISKENEPQQQSSAPRALREQLQKSGDSRPSCVHKGRPSKEPSIHTRQSIFIKTASKSANVIIDLDENENEEKRTPQGPAILPDPELPEPMQVERLPLRNIRSQQSRQRMTHFLQ